MRRALLALLGLIAAGCVTSERVMTPAGPGWYIECPRSQAGCMERAAEHCLLGYDVIDRSGQTGYVVTGNAVAPVYTGNLTVKCRGRRVANE